MSSVPTTSHLSESPTPVPGARRIHRHRRSAAISGDFDVIGLGLFSPPPPISKTSRHSAVLSGSLNMTQHQLSHQRLFLSSFVSHPQPSDAIEYPDSRFQFSNDDDFFNRPEQDPFHFPVKSSDMTLLSLPCTPRYLASPRKVDSTLNSPIRLKSNKNASSANCPLTPKLFLTEETTLNSENIPDAVIDLDKILNTNTNTNTNTNRHTCDNSDNDFEFGIRNQDDFLASPFARLGLSLFSSSAYSSPSYLRQPIRDQTADAIVEEDDLDDFRLAEEDMLEEQSEGTAVLDENDIVPSEVGSDIFANPQNTFHSLYLTNSENSSNSSLPSSGGVQKLPSASNIGKIPSNSSKDSAVSTFFSFSSTPVSKRSSAKATRYQSFYDQSHKISSALKYSSTESIPLISSCAIENTKMTGASGNECRTKVDKSLGHSSSLPSLKSNVKRPVPTTYNDFRVKRDIKNAKAGPQTSKGATVLEHLSKFPNTANLFNPLLSSKHQSRPVDPYTALSKQKKSIQTPVSKASNSPSSLLSEYSSTVTSAGDASTDRSSVMSQGEAHVSNLKASASEHSRCSTPIIVVSLEPDTFSSSNSASQEEVALESSIEGSPERSGVAVGASRRRPMSPGEKNILSSTVIPLFGKLEKQNNEKKASVVEFVCSETEHMTRSDEPVCATADRTISLRKHTRRKSDRFSSWFKRHK